jgi:hypothetical protein
MQRHHLTTCAAAAALTLFALPAVAGADTSNWGTINRNTMGAASAQLRTGPFAPPFGVGSLNLSVADAASKIAYGNEVDYAGLRVADISALGFSVYQTGEDAAISLTNLPNIQMEVDPNVASALSVNYSSLVYNPAAVPPNAWSNIDATTGAGWYFTNGTVAAVTGFGQGTGQRFGTLAEIKVAAPNAVVTDSLAIGKGRDHEWQGAVDGVVINDQTIDFEPKAGPVGPIGDTGAAGATGATSQPGATIATGAISVSAASLATVSRPHILSTHLNRRTGVASIRLRSPASAGVCTGSVSLLNGRGVRVRRTFELGSSQSSTLRLRFATSRRTATTLKRATVKLIVFSRNQSGQAARVQRTVR